MSIGWLMLSGELIFEVIMGMGFAGAVFAFLSFAWRATQNSHQAAHSHRIQLMAEIGHIGDQAGQQPLEQPADLNNLFKAGVGLGGPAQVIR